MKKIILIFSLTILTSCHCVETHLTKEEKEWFSAYEKGQSIIFKSNRGHLDTLIVTEKVETFGNKDCNWFEIGTIQNNMLNINFKSKTCLSEANCEGIISISKDKPDEKEIPFIRLFGLEFAPKAEHSLLKKKSIKLSMTKTVYKSAYFFEDQINSNSYGSNYLKSFYWDKKVGLIRYDLYNGEVFELLKKID